MRTRNCEHNKTVKRLVQAVIAVMILCGVMIMSGCGDYKPAGPGGERMQPYNPADGQYK